MNRRLGQGARKRQLEEAFHALVSDHSPAGRALLRSVVWTLSARRALELGLEEAARGKLQAARALLRELEPPPEVFDPPPVEFVEEEETEVEEVPRG